MLEKTITGNNKVRLQIEYPIVAGVDKDQVPQLFKVDENGALQVADMGGPALPAWDTVLLSYYDAGKTNLQTAIYKKAGVIVATITLQYAGGGLVANDALTQVSVAL